MSTHVGVAFDHMNKFLYDVLIELELIYVMQIQLYLSSIWVQIFFYAFAFVFCVSKQWDPCYNSNAFSGMTATFSLNTATFSLT